MTSTKCPKCERIVPERYSVGSGRFWCLECSESALRREAMTPFEQWLADGYAAGWIGPIICHSHDGLPTSKSEDIAWETGDPCLSILRLYANADEKAGVEENHLPSRRQP